MHTMLPTDVLASTIAADRTRTLQSAARRHRLTHGVTIRWFASPVALLSDGGVVSGVEFERTAIGADGRLATTGERFTLAADQVMKAIGQVFVPGPVADEALALDGRRIKVDADGRTTLPGVWAGGDCVLGDEDLTVVAVEHGKRAARSIHAALTA